MSVNSVQSPFPIFTDVDGNPLEDGYIYIGDPNLNPEIAVKTAYWDSAMVTPASQPVRTIGGYPSRSGTPARLYVDGDYSITVRNKNGTLVYNSPVETVFVNTNKFSDNFVGNIDDYVALQAVDTDYVTSVNLAELHPDVTGSGGPFNWDATADKSTANAGTIIDPSVSLALQGTGVGLGCWVRQYSGAINIGFFGPDKTGSVESTAKINTAFSLAGDYDEVDANFGTYLCDGIGKDKVSIRGRATFKATPSAANVVLLGRETGIFRYRRVDGISVDGSSTANGFSMKDIASTSNTSAGRWHLEDVRIQYCVKGIEKKYGNISNRYNGLSVAYCDFGYWAKGATSSDPDFSATMHSGADVFNQGHLAVCDLAAIYIDDTAGNIGQHVFNQVIMEGNPGFGVFVKNYGGANVPLVIDGCWCEGNATAGSVTIDTVAYTPRDLYFENTSMAEIRSTKFSSLELVNSSITMSNCWMHSGKTIITDTLSSLRIKEAFLDDFKGYKNAIIESVSGIARDAGGFAAVFSTIPRQKINNPPLSGVVIFSDDSSSPITYTGTSAVASTTQVDGLLNPSCQELVQPALHTALHSSIFTITSGKYYVSVIEIKRAVTDLQTIQIVGTSTLASDIQGPAIAGEWSTIASISKSTSTWADCRLRIRNDAATSTTVRLGSMQVVEFDSLLDALIFFNSRSTVA